MIKSAVYDHCKLVMIQYFSDHKTDLKSFNFLKN